MDEDSVSITIIATGLEGAAAVKKVEKTAPAEEKAPAKEEKVEAESAPSSTTRRMRPDKEIIIPEFLQTGRRDR